VLSAAVLRSTKITKGVKNRRIVLVCKGYFYFVGIRRSPSSRDNFCGSPSLCHLSRVQKIIISWQQSRESSYRNVLNYVSGDRRRFFVSFLSRCVNGLCANVVSDLQFKLDLKCKNKAND
jgi:hypothetical protein